MNPVIGIVFCAFSDNRQFVTTSYVEAISDLGGIPIIVPYSSSYDSFASYVKICDGFLFCGGDDITPILFGEEPLTERGNTDLKADDFHLQLMKYLLDSHLPILGICRGMQVLALALGGSIYQDISLRPEASLNHMQVSISRSDPSHKIMISKSSMLYHMIGDFAVVNSYHHQCIKAPGKNTRISAIASDGVIEAIELPGHPFALGTQWHPECMYALDKKMQNIFYEFIKKADNANKICLP